jgi:8-oxo-dGTP diphosphatase
MMKQIRLQAYLGDTSAQCELAKYCEESKDTEQSIFWYRTAAQNGSLTALEKCKELVIDLEPPKEYLKDLKCRIFPVGYLENYMFTAVCTHFNEKWILSMHKERDTWEPQGGHIEDGETPLECARRELFEESGIRDADIYPVCDYWGFDAQGSANGMVFLAVAHSLGELPESEMKEINEFDSLPKNLTYPNVTPSFFSEAEKLLQAL